MLKALYNIVLDKTNYKHDKRIVYTCTPQRKNICLQNAKLNKRVLRLHLKDVEEFESFSSCGSEFHRAGPA